MSKGQDSVRMLLRDPTTALCTVDPDILKKVLDLHDDLVVVVGHQGEVAGFL